MDKQIDRCGNCIHFARFDNCPVEGICEIISRRMKGSKVTIVSDFVEKCTEFSKEKDIKLVELSTKNERVKVKEQNDQTNLRRSSKST